MILNMTQQIMHSKNTSQTDNDDFHTNAEIYFHKRSHGREAMRWSWGKSQTFSDACKP